MVNDPAVAASLSPPTIETESEGLLSFFNLGLGLELGLGIGLGLGLRLRVRVKIKG